ncbi:spore germination protein [Sutcliffiella halmapala]|uniref:spore germination protein n=1 Tax=Sutcliffiella halmapala TaxID=79882 RepID=UPI0009959122|nr:spore germination protein [Sutcliffiella halmapala]
MDNILQGIKSALGDNEDFFMMDHFFGKLPVILLGYKTLIDMPKTISTIQEQLGYESFDEKQLEQKLLGIGDKINRDYNEVISSILTGKLIIHLRNDTNFVIEVCPVGQELNRSIESPVNENVIIGTLSSFNEDLLTNIGIVRKHIASDQLKLKCFSVGTDYSKNLALLYSNNTKNMQLISKITTAIESNKSLNLNSLQDVTNILGLSKWGILPQYTSTELPQEVTRSLEKGRIVLFVDRIPLALILPSYLWDMFSSENDRNFPVILMSTIRFLRIFASLLAIIIPGLYVALVSINPEILRIELALSIANSRDGVPYPALVETLIMLIILELTLEASIRLPKSIGPTITMVGGIILGQAVVEAKLVSNLLIIVLAATTIANSVLVGVQNTMFIRFFKYIILILASIYGVLGILIGLFFLCSYIASINSFGIPYLHFNFKGDMKRG